MRKITLTPTESKIMFDALDQGSPQQGLTVSEIRKALPVLDKIEESAEKRVVNTQNGPNEVLDFKETILELKESEYSYCLQKVENSSGWVSATFGRHIIKLIDKLKESPIIEEEKGGK
jgi:hypothetical protein